MLRLLTIISLGLFLFTAASAQPLWTYKTPGDYPLCLEQLPDITGNKTPGIIAGYDSGNIICFAAEETGTARIFWKARLKGVVTAIRTVEDTDKDGFPELIATTDLGTIACLVGGGPMGGKIIWTIDAVFNISLLEVTDDMDSDGINDIVYGGADHRVSIVSSKTGTPIWSRFFEANGDNTYIEGIVNAGDLNGDSVCDLYIQTWGARLYTISGTDGKDIRTSKAVNPYMTTLLKAKDINNDGINELLNSGNDGVLFLSNGKDGQELWRALLGRPVRSLYAADDLTGDGVADCLAGNAEGKVFCLSGNDRGTILPVWSSALGDVCRTIATCNDINNDGRSDVIAGAENGVISAFSGADGKALWQWKSSGVVRKILVTGKSNTNNNSYVAAALLDGSLILLPCNMKNTSLLTDAPAAGNEMILKHERNRSSAPQKNVQEVPILLYHDVSPKGLKPGDSNPVNNFRLQMDYLVSEGYTAVSLDEIAGWIKGSVELPGKPVCITFDGQYSSHYTHLYKILKERGLFGISYITTDWIGTVNHLDWHQLRELESSGVMEIENHTINHAFFPSASRDEISRQVSLSNKSITDHLCGKISRHHAYPSGGYNSNALGVMREQNFLTATTVQPRKATKSDNLYSLPRYTIEEKMTLESFKAVMGEAASVYPAMPYEYAGTVGKNWTKPGFAEVDKEGRLWICDIIANCVRVFSPDGNEASFSPITLGLTQNKDTMLVRALSGIAITPSGETLVSISSRTGALRYSGIFRYRASDGKLLTGIDLPFFPGDMDIDSKGLIYIVDKLSCQWYIYSPDWKTLSGSPFGTNTGSHVQRGISVKPDGTKVYIISETDFDVKIWQGTSTISSAKYSMTGKLISNLSYLSSGIDVMDDGKIFVGCFTEGMVLVFDSEHKIIGQISRGGFPSLNCPYGTAFGQDGKTIWIMNSSGQVQCWKQKAAREN